jgi:hypothetical protein
MGFTSEDLDVQGGPLGPQLKLLTQSKAFGLTSPKTLFPQNGPFQLPGVGSLPPALGELLRGVQLNDTMDLAYPFPLGGIKGADIVDEAVMGIGIKYDGVDNEPENTLLQSHKGDLSFLHGMTRDPGEDPKETQAKMLAWSRTMLDVLHGKLDGSQKISAIPGLEEAFGAEGMRDLTLQQFLAGQGKDPALMDPKTMQLRALGSLLHMVQDSMAAGHTERDKDGKILSFQPYGPQDHDKHTEADDLHLKPGQSFEEMLAQNPNALKAVTASADLLALLDQGQGTEAAMKLLEEQVFQLSPSARPSQVAPNMSKEEQTSQAPNSGGPSCTAPIPGPPTLPIQHPCVPN